MSNAPSAINASHLQNLPPQLAEAFGNSLQDALVTNTDGNISITTKNKDDQVNITQQGSTINVTINGQNNVSIDTTKTQSIAIHGGNGNDRIIVDKSVNFPLTLDGGMGQNTIVSASQTPNNIYAHAGIDHVIAKPTDQITYQQLIQLMSGQGNSYAPIADGGCVPPPPQPVSSGNIATNSNTDALPADGTSEAQDAQDPWNQVMSDMTTDNATQTEQATQAEEKEKTDKMEKLLKAALASGNMDLAIMLSSSLETEQANQLSGTLLDRIQSLQDQRQQITTQLSNLGTDSSAAQQASALNNQASGIGTDIQMLQTFLQEASSQKSEAQDMASNYIKNEHDTAMAILRNG